MSHECKTTENLSYIPTVSYPVTVGNHLSAVFDTSHNFPMGCSRCKASILCSRF